jgi:sRNA-binding protein
MKETAMPYETCLTDVIKPRPLDDLKRLFEHVVGKYQRCFKNDFYERQPLADNVIDELCVREGWNLDTAKAIVKFYHFPWQFRSRFQGGMIRVDLDGKVRGKLSVEDAEAIRHYALSQMKEQKEKHERIKNSGANIPVTFLPKVKIPEKPATSILSGLKQLKAQLAADVSELELKIQDLFPEELVEVLPDLERPISQLMEAIEQIQGLCKSRTNGAAHDHEERRI